jgi:hypothetical protein
MRMNPLMCRLMRLTLENHQGQHGLVTWHVITTSTKPWTAWLDS